MNSLLVHGLAMAGGAAAGAAYDEEDRGRGALVGAGVGMLGASGYRLAKNVRGPAGKSAINLYKRMPAKGALLTGGLIGAGLAAGTALKPDEYEMAATAKPSVTGTAEDSDVQYKNYRYSLSDRTASMNVSGDLVFGLHNLRHG